MTRAAFCGLGRMGLPMAIRLIESGHEVAVWNRTPGKARPAVAAGGRQATTPADAATGAEVAVTMLSTPEAVQEVLFGREGLSAGLAAGSTLLEMSTVGPDIVRDVSHRLGDAIDVLDAPVLGSVPQAKDGSLRIFVGAISEEAARRWFPFLEAMGTPRYLGSPGSGAAMKLVVNSTLVALMTALGEALALADVLGLDEAAVLDVLGDSPIGVPARGKRSNLETGMYPPNFTVSLAAKDAGLVVDTAVRLGLELPVARAGLAWMARAADGGFGDLDYSAVIAHQRGAPANLPEPG
jgi:3-hydroxyisobutyrate dehydrogenase-like beta-hydroxyacid dehydrogenase